MLKHKLVDFIIQFMEEVDKEISEMKLFVSNTLPQTSFSASTNSTAVERKSPFCCRVILDAFRLRLHVPVILLEAV